jgi:peptidoglycan L-alanyl-D-glutamate endopeptidase CwlK
MSEFKLSKTSLGRLEGVDEELVAIVKRAITITPIDFGIPWMGGLRTIADQRKLVEKKVSHTMKSKHIEGNAFDVVAYVGARPSWELALYDDLADTIIKSAKEIGVKQLKWGGAWHIDNILEWDGTALEAYDDMVKVRTAQGRRVFTDMPHFQKGV